MTNTLALSTSAMAEWIPFATATGYFLGTFVLEDAAAVGAGLSLATGGISWLAAFTACFLGIWMGDAGLYALARWAGRSWFERSPLRRFATKVADSERWFSRRGTLMLIFCRLVPGTRLPTYLAAGFLRVPLPRFLLVTGAAACFWTVAILILVQAFGGRLANWLGIYSHSGFILAGAGILLILLLQWLHRACVNFNFRRFAARIGRWRHWEFWPAWMFYPPVIIYCAWLSLKYRGLTVATASNPGMFSGGIVGESKMETLDELFLTSPEFTAQADRVAGGTLAERMQSLGEIRARLNLDFPFILKPDVGQRGAGVKLIRSTQQAEAYLRHTAAPLIVQRYAPGPHEVGVFYYRFPNEPAGHIFAITEKCFPVLTGDGHSTVEQHVWNDPRARFMADEYLSRLDGRRNEVLAAGMELKLVEAGNHAQGCIFRDGMCLLTPSLANRVDKISKDLSGFFIGRYDIRYANEHDLREGRNFQIIELNGAASEATSIYDSRNSVFAAYRTLFRQWDMVYAIGAANRQRGFAPTGVKHLWQKWREYGKLAATYPPAD